MSDRTTSTHPNARILPTWDNVKTALAREVKRTKGAGLVKVIVAFDRHGNVIKYTQPRVTRLEPNRKTVGSDGIVAALDMLLEGLSE